MAQDILCLDDLDEFGTELGDDLASLEQDNYHRLITPPGRNIDDPDFGLGIDRLLSGDTHDIASLGSRIEAEFRKDPRNAQVRVLVTPFEREKYRISISVVTDKSQLLEMTVISGRNGTELV